MVAKLAVFVMRDKVSLTKDAPEMGKRHQGGQDQLLYMVEAWGKNLEVE